MTLNKSSQHSEHIFVISRTFNAPRDVVFKAWTEAERLKRWFGPKGFTMPSCSLDLREGGTFLYSLRSQGGQEMWGKWVFREIDATEKIVFVSSFSDQQGNTARAPFSETWPLETHSTVTFEEQEGRTTVTLRGAALNATDAEMETFTGMFGSMEQGWGGTFDQLEDYLANS